ncbi:lytic transglycosylase domain-containing protein [Rhizobium beringeri]|nr:MULTISPECIES: lytic transglycosylase domain-containing protein [Rhizobium]
MTAYFLSHHLNSVDIVLRYINICKQNGATMAIKSMKTMSILLVLSQSCLGLAVPSFVMAEPKIEVGSATCIDGATPPDEIKRLILKEATRQQFDEKLVLAIAGQESRFGQRVNSKTGARGPMQLMPTTAVRYGVTDICDARQNIRGGVSYLKDLTAMFGGNIMLVIAAYNAGENRIITARGIPSIGETVSYTALVTNAYFGLDKVFASGNKTGRAAGPGTGSTASGVDLLASMPSSDEPLPINRTTTQSRHSDWIDGSVLYVQ